MIRVTSLSDLYEWLCRGWETAPQPTKAGNWLVWKKLPRELDMLEAIDFSANLAVVSSLSQSYEYLKQDWRVKNLINALHDSPSLYAELCHRLVYHLAQEHTGYRHPDDIPVAAYLYALYIHKREVAYIYARTIRTETQQRFWLAHYVAGLYKENEE